MPTFDYSRMLATASKLLAKFGTSMTFTRHEAGTYDDETGTVTETTTDYVVTGVVQALGNAADATAEDLVMAKTRLVLLDAGGNLTYDPEPGDTVDFDGYTWTVRGCTPIAPGGTRLLYKTQVGR